MRPRVKVLTESVVQKIAAGEVVERPASIVKELVENAVDAQATRIEVKLADGGRKLITVSDDGWGMSAEDAALAIQRHATSKISSEEDLNSMHTFGFRGEALAAVGAVSQMEITSRTADSGEGTRVRVEGGSLRTQEPAGRTKGTTVSVANLFFNVPARKKFLRSRATELGHVEQALHHLALSDLSRAFTLEHEAETVLHIAAAADLKVRIAQLYGRELADQTVPFSAEGGGMRVSGAVSNAHVSFSRPKEIWLAVNGRPVRDRMVQAAVLEGFRGAVMEHRYPFAVIHLTVPPDAVDVNVHPTKTEVRFADTQGSSSSSPVPSPPRWNAGSQRQTGPCRRNQGPSPPTLIMRRRISASPSLWRGRSLFPTWRRWTRRSASSPPSRSSVWWTTPT